MNYKYKRVCLSQKERKNSLPIKLAKFLEQEMRGERNSDVSHKYVIALNNYLQQGGL